MASEKILESKKAKVAALTEKLQNSVSFVLVDYKGITVEEDTKLRKAGSRCFLHSRKELDAAFCIEGNGNR
mgnify:CR=1 FL=1